MAADLDRSSAGKQLNDKYYKRDHEQYMNNITEAGNAPTQSPKYQ